MAPGRPSAPRGVQRGEDEHAGGMSILVATASVILIALVLLDGFEAMLLPRRVSRSIRFARLFYVYSWLPWAAVARRMRPGKRREMFLSFYGPLSVIALFG